MIFTPNETRPGASALIHSGAVGWMGARLNTARTAPAPGPLARRRAILTHCLSVYMKECLISGISLVRSVDVGIFAKTAAPAETSMLEERKDPEGA